MPRTASTAQAARAIGVAPTTLQKYAQQGRVPFDLTPGGHRRFDPAEVAAHLNAPTTLAVIEPIAQQWVASAPEGLRPVHVSVFGSVARGDDHPRSDIDLFIVRPSGVRTSDRAWSGRLVELILRLRDATDRDVQVFDVDPEGALALPGRSPRFDEEIRRDGQLVAGLPLEVIAA